MKSLKLQSKLLVACIALVSVVTFLKAGYYKPDFFPIGLTGLNYTGGDPDGFNCPYGHVKDQNEERIWYWDQGTNNEQSLIYSLGVNCIGCSDAMPSYMIGLNPNSPGNNDYLNKVCMPSDDQDTSKRVYIMLNGLYIEEAIVHGRARIYKLDLTDMWHVTEGDYALFPWERIGKGIIVNVDGDDTTWRDTLIKSDREYRNRASFLPRQISLYR
ncbi:hypothetical protein GX441_06610 [bacterium]|nr:hypothetical protein [bacterium]